MHRRSFLISTTAAAAVSPLLATPALALRNDKLFRKVRDSEMAYIDQGSGRPLVFLHGNPTSSYLWRNIIPYVTDGHRAIAPDLIGMGDSGKPEIEYSYKDHAAYLFEFLDGLDLQNAILVIHDWGSAMGFHYARTRPERIAGVVFMEATTAPAFPFPSYEALGPFEEFLRNLKADGIGEELVLNQNMFVEEFLRAGGTKTPLSDEVMAEYRRPYPTPESRLPLLRWPREIPVGGVPEHTYNVSVANNEWLLASDLPKLLFHVSPGAIIPIEAAEFLKANVKNLESIFLGEGGHFMQEDYPDEIGRSIAGWLQKI